jgi:hypothetical protein
MKKIKWKIGVSLLIALFFIVPTGAVMAGDSKEAVDTNTISKTFVEPDYQDLMVKLPGDEPISQEDPFCGVYIQGIEGLPSGSLIAPGPQVLDFALWYDPTCYPTYGPPIVKAFIEIYEECCGKEVVMYETSFEDNFDIYNNWLQEDADCGLTKEGNVGFFDTWTWSDARASPECDGTHSMKNTMYDIYKGNQDDYLECTKSFDISDQQGINISFDIWVEGDYDYLYGGYWTPYDFLDFEIGDDGGNWVNPDAYYNGFAPTLPLIFTSSSSGYLVEGAYKFFDTTMCLYDPDATQDFTPIAEDLGGGWWHVWYEADTSWLAMMGLNVNDIQFRFSWHSDPEFQYEGAYVDCVKVVSIEDCEDKIFQTHTQGPVVLDPANPDIYYDPSCGNYYIRMPLVWDAEFVEKCGQKESEYTILAWIEVLNDPCTYWTPYDWPFPAEITVFVGEWSSCNVENLVIETSFEKDPIIPGPGTMMAGDDAHIMADVHLCGAVPYDDLVVNAYGEKITHEVLYESSCDTTMEWEFGHFDCTDSIWHITDTDSWDAGGKALACFDKNTNHYHNNMYVDYALNAKHFDLEDMLTLDLKYYTKYITQDANDYWAIMLEDTSTNYVLGNIGGVGFPTHGYQPTWIGPMQPAGVYQDFDLMAAYDYWHDIRGMFTNCDGTQSYDLGFGFAMWGTDGAGYTNVNAENHEIYWSGMYFDELQVVADVIGEKVWEQAIVIPYMEPCDWEPVQFEWEDIPYSNYLITVECEEGCDNCGDPDKEAFILVVSNKEKADDKEVESIDLTGEGGEWGISSSDYDNYLASNFDTLSYSPNMNIVAQLCPDNDGACEMHDIEDPCCIDVSHLGAAPFGGQLLMDFTAWWDIEWYWDYCVMEVTTVCKEPAPTHDEWSPVLYFSDGGFWESSEAYYGDDDGWIDMSLLELGPVPGGWTGAFAGASGLLTAYGVPADLATGMIDLGQIIFNLDPTATQFGLRFRFVSDCDPRCPNDGYGEYRGIKLDDLIITNMIFNDDEFPPVIEDFEDAFDDMDNWCSSAYQIGQYWEHSIDIAGDHVWCTDFPAAEVRDALVWTTEIKDCYEAYLSFETAFDFGTYAFGLVEISELGTDQWYTLDKFEGTEGPGVFPDFVMAPIPDVGDPYVPYNLNYWVGKDIQIRFLANGGHGGYVSAGQWCVKNIEITGKQDHTPPMTTLTMSGTMADAGWYSSAVQCEITAVDNVAMGEIHYILDGVHKVVPGDRASFTVTANGAHNLEYWGVDKLGNEEAHHIVPTFRIDSGSPPTVAITAPTPGLYLFGNQILSASKVFIIGAFNIEATASDAESGVYRVQFYLDGDILAEDTEVPYNAYCAVKHMGAGTIKAVAEDFSGNTAEDTLDITYYKFL